MLSEAEEIQDSLSDREEDVGLVDDTFLKNDEIDLQTTEKVPFLPNVKVNCFYYFRRTVAKFFL